MITEVALGTITCPSGRLVVADTGYLGLWSGDAAPAMPAELLDGLPPEARESVAHAVDLAVAGPDAERAARGFDRQPGRWLYDVPAHALEETVAAFEAHRRAHGLDARLVPEGRRVPHRERAERAAEAGGDGFTVHGVPMVVAAGLPTDRELTVSAVRRDFGRVGARWDVVAVEVEDVPIFTFRRLGVVGVDAARLSLIDADGLAAWEHENPVDGRADVAFWGRSAGEAAAEFQAPPLGTPGEDGVYGWAGLDVPEAVRRARAVGAWVDAGPDRRLAYDFRPHSHHWQVLARVRASEHEAGVIEVGGTRTMCLMTSWGDGLFPVHAEYGEDGRLVRILIVLADAERVRRTEEMYDRMG
ncbi:hypothetical protein [Actinomadura fibrosa]|uniref:Uncharacterized protein n=1 Tax=Actinomadura fibrosa TaxID=111802 RepID=A0ABW2XGJ8_9ACTN|nr:hypothetical protein [Actinomadura fibrosa]